MLFPNLLRLVASLAAVLVGPILCAQPAPTQKSVPPAGVVIPESDRTTLQSSADELMRKLVELRKSQPEQPLWADIAVLHKAVDWALRFDEFMDARQVATAQKLLDEGNRRFDQLAAGKPEWLLHSGVRGYVSKIDGSIQPYGLVLPENWNPGEKQKRPAVLWLHGRSENLTELAFCAEQMKGRTELSVPQAVVLNLYGRFCNASKFAGEVDAFEALDAVSTRMPLDRARTGVAGFSMGGASTWHLATHHPSLWCAASPGAGFAETANYAGVFKKDRTPPPWWEQTLYRWYDADIYAGNLVNCPLMAYSGEIDPQKASADLMEKTLVGLGLKLDRLVGPKTGHKYEPGAKKQLEDWLSARLVEGRKSVPPHVRFVTYTLRYASCDWVTIDTLTRHWERSEIDAEIVDEGTIRVKTTNVAAFTLHFSEGPLPFDPTHPPRVIIDGTELTGPPVRPPWRAAFSQSSGKWGPVDGSNAGTALVKTHGLSGPIDDAFLDRFIFVRSTGQSANPLVAAWVEGELARALKEWRRVFRGEPIVKDDTAVTAGDIANANLVLWGDPSSNAILKKIAGELSTTTRLNWTPETVEFGPYKLPAAHYVPVLIAPNPLNRRRYVVLNSSFTFRMGSRTSNSLQTPKLPDWALIDLRTPPDDSAPGLVFDAGFFDEHWRLP